MTNEWYMSTLDGVKGPFSSSQLKRFAHEGQLEPDMFVKKGSDGKWVEARNLKGLAFGIVAKHEAPDHTHEAPASPQSAGLAPDAAISTHGAGHPDTAAGRRHTEGDEEATSRAGERKETPSDLTSPVPSEPASETADATDLGLPSISTTPSSIKSTTPVHGTAARRKDWTKDPRMLWGFGVVGVTTIVVLVVVLIVSRETSAPSTDKSVATKSAIIDLTALEFERGNVDVFVDRRKVELPDSEPLVVAVKPGTRSIEVRRRGHPPHQFRHKFSPGERYAYSPTGEGLVEADWERALKIFTRWQTTFDEARADERTAARTVDDFNKWFSSEPAEDRPFFEDRVLPAKAHLLAARLLIHVGLRERVPNQCERGFDCLPKSIDREDPDLYASLDTFFGLAVLHRLCSRGEDGPTTRVPCRVNIGTGFCVAEDGYILTNRHVVDDARDIRVQLYEHDDLIPARLITSSKKEDEDMALLQIKIPPAIRLTPIPLSSKEVLPGTRVCALGFPDDGTHTTELSFAKGDVSSIKENNGIIKIDCNVSPGNSGGPVLDGEGCAVGMVEARTKITPKRMGFGFAIPATTLREFLTQGGLRDALAVSRGHPLSTSDWSEVYRARAPSVVMVVGFQ